MQQEFSVVLNDTTYPLLTLTVETYGFNSDFVATLSVLTEQRLFDLTVPSRAVLQINEDGHISVLSQGWLTRIHHKAQTEAGDYYVLEVHSLWWPLLKQRHTRVFVDKSLSDIFTQVLTGAGFAIEQLQLTLGEFPGRLAQCIQYQESDAEFVFRLCRYYGLLTDSSALGDILIRDTVIGWKNTPKQLPLVPYRGVTPEGHHVSRVLNQYHLRAKSFRLQSANLDDADNRLTIGAAGAGSWTHLGAHYSTVEAGKILHARYTQALEASRHTVTLMSNVPTWQLGDIIQVEQAAYRLTHLSHRYQANGQTLFSPVNDEPSDLSAGYQCIAQAVAAVWDYRLLPDLTTVHNVWLRGTIDAPVGQTQAIDAQGCYRVRLADDELTHEPGYSSGPIRCTTFYSGEHSGMHFPLQAGTEVLLHTINGDLNQPVILGVLPNERQPSLTTSANPSEHRWQTAGGQGLTFDDDPQNPLVSLHTADCANQLLMQSGEKPNFAVISQQGDIRLSNQGKHTQTIEQDKQVSVQGQQQRIAQAGMTVTTHTGDIRLSSESHFTAIAADSIVHATQTGDITAKAANIRYQAQRDVTLRAKEHIRLHTTEGDLTINSGGPLTLTAGQVFTLMQGGGMVQLDAQGNLIIQGNSVNFNANTISIEGNQSHQSASGQAAPLPKVESMAPVPDIEVSSENKKTAAEKYRYYLVKYDGTKQLLTTSIDETFAEIAADFNLSDYFEEDRWVESEAANQTVQQNETEEMMDRRSLGVTSLLLSSMPSVYAQAKKHELIIKLQNIQSEIVARFNEQKGVLVEAGYQVAETETGIFLNLFFVKPINSGHDYRSLIKNVLTGPIAVEQPMNKQTHWEFLFIWVERGTD